MKLIDKFTKLPLSIQIAILGAGAFGAYKLVKFITQQQPVTKPLPTGGAGIPATGFDSSGKPIAWDPEPLAASLFNVLDGASFVVNPAKSGAMVQLVSLPTDDMIVAVYNTFNVKYGDGETLTQWIADEWTFPGQSQALTKLRGLGLD